MVNSSRESKTVSTAIVALGRSSTVVLTLVLAASLSRTLEQAAYGTFQQIIYIYTMMAVVLQLGAPQTTAYLLPKLSRTQGKSLLQRILFFLLANGIVFSCLLYFGADTAGSLLKNPMLPPLLRTYAPIPMLILPTLALPGVCLAYGRPGMSASFQIISKLITLIAVSVPILLGYSVRTAIMVWVLASFATLLLGIGVMYLPYRGCTAVAGPYGLLHVLRFGLPVAAAGVAGVLLAGADRFVVSRLFGAEVFAQYVNGAVQLPFLQILTGSLAAVLLPVFSRLADSEQGRVEAKDIWSRVIRKNAAFLYPCACFAFFFADDIMRLVYSERYVVSAPFFRIYLMAIFVRVVPYLPLMLGLGAVWSYLVGATLACLIAWSGAFVLCTHFGNPALAAVSYVCAVYVMSLFLISVISRRLNVRIMALLPLREVSGYLAASIVTALVSFLVARQVLGNSFPSTLLRLILGIGVFSILYAIVTKSLGLETIGVLKPVLQRFSSVRLRLLRL